MCDYIPEFAYFVFVFVGNRLVLTGSGKSQFRQATSFESLSRELVCLYKGQRYGGAYRCVYVKYGNSQYLANLIMDE